ncbi:2-hydroxyacid dehydrogenase [Streptomyces pactum]|uniref:2-hydroxyacid dehydrogenase n=1 Tax=Streptomyces pactum TaxID=68249 RepID=UPI000A790076|nr:2-hydroxyacid dehydrogenase [Streptomyces pactum]
MLDHRILSRFHERLKAATEGSHVWLDACDWDAGRTSAALPDVEVYVGSRLRAEDARRAVKLRLVHVVGAGYDGIALDALAPGVTVATTHHHGRSIAEHVLMSVLMLSRDVLGADRALRAGRWRNVAVDPGLPLGTTLPGRRVGIIGFGETGTEVARLCQAAGLRVRAVRRDPSAPVPAGLRPDWVGGGERLPELLAESDIVVVTVPLSPATRGLIGPAELAAMGPESLLVNVARGPVVREEALYEALRSGAIGGAALDVWWAGPPQAPSRLPFHELPNVLMTPHHCGHTTDTFAARAAEIAGNIGRLRRGDPLVNVVHPGDHGPVGQGGSAPRAATSPTE